MSARVKTSRRDEPPAPTPPVDVVDGIPDRSDKPRTWKYVLIAVIFVGWVGMLVACVILGAR